MTNVINANASLDSSVSSEGIEVLFSSPALYRTLAIFFDFPDDMLFPRQISRHTETDIKSVIREIRRLEGMGILHARKMGRAQLYGADGSHPLHDELVSLFAKTRGHRKYVLHESALARMYT